MMIVKLNHMVDFYADHEIVKHNDVTRLIVICLMMRLAIDH